MKTYKQFKAKLLRDRSTRMAYEDLKQEFAFIRLIIQKRIEQGFTQKELARRIGTKQSAISRLESGAYNPSISFVNKVAQALGAKVRISIG